MGLTQLVLQWVIGSLQTGMQEEISRLDKTNWTQKFAQSKSQKAFNTKQIAQPKVQLGKNLDLIL